MSIVMMLGCIVLGLSAGSLSGLLGIGGGVIMVPAAMFFFGMTQHVAQGTTLAVMVPPIGILAAWSYYRSGHVNIKAAAIVCVGFSVGGFAGAKLATDLSNTILSLVFGAALALIAIKVGLGDHVDAREKAHSHHRSAFMNACLLIALGLFVGCVSGLIGVGGGILLVPGLVILFGMSQKEAQGTTLALMVPPIGLLAALEYWRQGDVHVGVAALICLGFFVGAPLGARVAKRLPAAALRKVFAVAMLAIAAKLILAAVGV